MANLTFGADPEFLVLKNEKPVSAIGVVPGTKDKKFTRKKYEFYYDNVMAECTVKPGKTPEITVNNIQKCLQEFSKLINPYKLDAIAAHNFNRSELKHEDAFKIACKRESCAYELYEPELPTEIYMTSGLRVAGGHIHIGSKTAQDELNCIEIVRMLDLFLGIPSVYLDASPESKMRKQVYGQAGRFRQPKHGVEYRSLSNFWLKSPELAKLVFDICEFTIDFVEQGKHREFWAIDIDRLNDDEAWDEEDFDPADCHTCHGYDVNLLRDSIDNSNKKSANKLMPLVKENMPSHLWEELQKCMEKKHSSFYEEWQLAA